jgi:hypothetical protein
MHVHRIAGPPAGVARPGTPEFEPQRRLLLELAVDSPASGDSIGRLSAILDGAPTKLEAAAHALERVGLCERRGERLYASTALRAGEALWPLAL